MTLKERNPTLPGVSHRLNLCYINYYYGPKKGLFSREHNSSKFQNHQWLQSKDIYRLHKPVRKKFKYRKTIVPVGKVLMQADFIDFSLFKSYNGNYKYILVVIDSFSKKAYTVNFKTSK